MPMISSMLFTKTIFFNYTVSKNNYEIGRNFFFHIEIQNLQMGANICFNVKEKNVQEKITYLTNELQISCKLTFISQTFLVRTFNV